MSELYPYKLKAFHKKEGIDLRITSSRVRLLALLLMFLILACDYLINFDEQVIQASFFVLIFIIALTYPWAFNEREKEHQKQIGTAIFRNDCIDIDGTSEKFKWEEVIELGIGAVKGEDIFSWYGMYGPKFSAGQNAFLVFKTNSDSQKIYFKFETYKDQQIFKDLLFDQCSKGNLKLTTVYNGLGLEYEEIQKLKTAYNNA